MIKNFGRGVVSFCVEGASRKVLLLSLILASTAASAQADREGMWEIGGTLLDLSSVDVSGPSGSSLYVDDETGFGFTGAYNFTNRLGLGVDISYSDPQYRATLVPDGIGAPEVINAELDVNVIHFKGIFNILDEDFTPYVEVGAGWTYVDSNIVEGISSPGCWWTWWGYTCPTFVDTYTDTRTSISYAVGLRYDMDSDMLIKASWGVIDIDTNRAEDIELDTIQVSFAWRF